MATEYREALTLRGGGVNAERRLRPVPLDSTTFADLETLLDEIVFGQQVTGTAAVSQAIQTLSGTGVELFAGTGGSAQAAQSVDGSGASSEESAPVEVAAVHGRRRRYDIPITRQQMVTGGGRARQARQRANGTGVVRIVGKGAVVSGVGVIVAKGACSTDRRDEREILDILAALEWVA